MNKCSHSRGKVAFPQKSFKFLKPSLKKNVRQYMKTIKTIAYKTLHGGYQVVCMEFESEQHFNNWYTAMSSKGCKIIGVIDEKQNK